MAASYLTIFAGVALDPTVVEVVTGQDIKDAIVPLLGPYGPHAIKVIGMYIAASRLRSILFANRSSTP